MYLPSDSPLLTGQREDAAREEACSNARIQATRLMMATGRAQLFSTIVSPDQIMEQFGIGAAVNTQKLQDQSLESRGAILSNGSGSEHTAIGGPSIQDIINGAPEVASQPNQTGCSNVVFAQRPLPDNPTPGMPQRAPVIRRTDVGRMFFRGAPPTYPDTTSQAPGLPSGSGGGLTGIAPPWSDAWVMPQGENVAADTGVLGWIQSNPWWALAIAGAGLFAATQGRKGRR